ncbi:hypothetical protein BGZ51_006782, partial [Haplosporangium sp. Z 767]
ESTFCTTLPWDTDASTTSGMLIKDRTVSRTASARSAGHISRRSSASSAPIVQPVAHVIVAPTNRAGRGQKGLVGTRVGFI